VSDCVRSVKRPNRQRIAASVRYYRTQFGVGTSPRIHPDCSGSDRAGAGVASWTVFDGDSYANRH